jgi:hypothetical protein
MAWPNIIAPRENDSAVAAAVSAAIFGFAGVTPASTALSLIELRQAMRLPYNCATASRISFIVTSVDKWAEPIADVTRRRRMVCPNIIARHRNDFSVAAAVSAAIFGFAGDTPGSTALPLVE